MPDLITIQQKHHAKCHAVNAEHFTKYAASVDTNFRFDEASTIGFFFNFITRIHISITFITAPSFQISALRVDQLGRHFVPIVDHRHIDERHLNEHHNLVNHIGAIDPPTESLPARPSAQPNTHFDRNRAGRPTARRTPEAAAPSRSDRRRLRGDDATVRR